MQSYSRDVLAFLFLALTLAATVTSKSKVKAPLLLNRKQTEEWKGWMQARVFLAESQKSSAYDSQALLLPSPEAVFTQKSGSKVAQHYPGEGFIDGSRTV